jgi:hypothetical protein
MKRAGRWSYSKTSCWVLLSVSMMLMAPAHGQELLKAIEPGTGYSRMKQWAIDHDLLFENFTKDSLVISGQFQEAGDAIVYQVHLLSKFCAGDDYAGRAYSTALQQIVRTDSKGDDRSLQQIFEKHRQYVEALAGKPSEEGRFPGDYKLRRERVTEQRGVAVGYSSAQGDWELGMFFREPYLMIQVLRSKDELCK